MAANPGRFNVGSVVGNGPRPHLNETRILRGWLNTIGPLSKATTRKRGQQEGRRGER